MRKYLFLLIALFPIISAAQSNVSAADKYIAKYHQLAILEMESTGIPASITLAQALHESANGTSQLAVKANNHFGVRCSSNWNGKRFQSVSGCGSRFGHESNYRLGSQPYR